jgi:hypothetical protein
MAYDAKLVRDVLHVFVQAVFGSLRRRACDYRGIRKAKCGAVTFVQRFGDALNLNLHFHTLVLDGIYLAEEGGQVVFRAVPPPNDAEVARVTERIQRRVARLLERRGLGPKPIGTNPTRSITTNLCWPNSIALRSPDALPPARELATG